ncbi:MAG: SgcJ/EcaC family oxidoreductase [Planctomycetes bacterium]|nr:SgcJ/EcaC family oxidoreductase [Planctomycetota bacterium]
MNRTLLFAVCLAILSRGAFATESDHLTDDEGAIRAAIASYVDAFNKGDATAVAEHWAETGEWIDPEGTPIQGRDAILAEMKTYFAGDQKPQIELLDLSVQFLAPSVAVEQGTALVTRPGEAASESSYLAIHVRENGKWRLSSVRELAPRPSPPPSHYEQLRELEWMIGEWVDDQGGDSITTRGEWTANRNFISRSFTVMIEDRVDLSGTQVIGWDPAANTIRSWVFDSDGGITEGVWSRRDDGWSIRAVGVLPDGRKASMVNIIRLINDNTFTLQSVGREVDGELLPNIDEVTVIRK